MRNWPPVGRNAGKAEVASGMGLQELVELSRAWAIGERTGDLAETGEEHEEHLVIRYFFETFLGESVEICPGFRDHARFELRQHKRHTPGGCDGTSCKIFRMICMT